MSDSRRLWLAVALLFAVALAVYAPALHGDFIWDDDDYVTQNGVLRSLGGLWRLWVEPTSIPQYYPLVHTTLWLDFRLWGLDPFGYHLANVLLHATSAALLLVVLRRLRVPGALGAALVFAAHPVHVESVAWITERKNVLSLVFYLLAVLAWLRWRPLDGAPGRGRYWPVLVLFLCALLSKTVTCSLPAAILLLVWWRRGRLTRADVVPTLPLFALGLLMAMVTVWLERGHVGAEGSAWDYSMTERLLIASRAVWFYAGKLVWPAGLTFSYPKWAIDAGDPVAWAFPAAALGLLAALWLLRGRIGRGALVAMLLFGGTLVPALGFFDVFPMRYSFVADHFQYHASLGPIALAAAAAATRLPARVRTATVAAAVLVLGTLAWRQARVYDGHVPLWTDTLAKNPDSFLAHTNLGKIFTDRGDHARAIEHLRRAIAIDDSLYETHANLGVALYGTGDIDGAIRHFERTIELRPDHPAGHNNIAAVLNARGELDRALEHGLRALAVGPDHHDVHSTLASIYSKQGRAGDAVRHLQRALDLAAGDPTTLLNAVDVLERVGRRPKALEIAIALAGIAPDRTDVPARIAALLAAVTASMSPDDTLRAAIAQCAPIPRSVPAVLAALVGELERQGRADAAAAVARHLRAR